MPGNYTINRKVAPLLSGDTRHWEPVDNVTSFLWVRFIGRASWPGRYWIHHKKAAFLDLEIIDRGTMTIRSATGKFTVPEKGAAIIPPGEFTLAADDGEIEKRHIGLTGILCMDNLHEFALDRIVILPDFSDMQFNTIFESLYEMADKQCHGSMHDYAALAYKLLLILSGNAKTLHLPRALAEAKSFIEWNFSRKLSLEEICAHAKCSKTTLQWQFGHYLRTTPVKYLTGVRMKFAQRALTDHELSIKVIADQCGYDNPFYFSNVFKEHFGCSPRAYRKMRQS